MNVGSELVDMTTERSTVIVDMTIERSTVNVFVIDAGMMLKCYY